MPRSNHGHARRRDAAAPARPGPCPCGTGETYEACCAPLHAGVGTAATAERLMRSRYSAYAVRDEAYLLRSWHSTTRPAAVDLDPKLRWTGLEILGTTDGSVFHTEGTVAFVADYVDRGTAGSLQENSFFQRENGVWVYVRAL